MSFETTDLAARIGVRIQTDTATLLSGSHASEIRALLERRGVLVLPQANLTGEEQVTFARTLGGVIEQGGRGIFRVSLDPQENAMANYLLGTVMWHIDGWSDDVPTLASLLSAHAVSPVGGQTEFANTYAAFDDLPEARKHVLKQLKVVHTMEATLRDIFEDPTPEQKRDWAAFPKRIHPLVWTHRSGRKSLVLGSSTSHIEGMPLDEGRALLKDLLAWATRPEFVYRHEWTKGDLVIWDNTGCLHRVERYPADSGRMMHRTTLVGEEAIA